MTDLVSVTTYSVRLRHLAEVRDPARGRSGRGISICNGAVYVEMYDQAALDAVKAKYIRDYEQIPVSSLPLCRRCEKKAGGP